MNKSFIKTQRKPQKKGLWRIKVFIKTRRKPLKKGYGEWVLEDSAWSDWAHGPCITERQFLTLYCTATYFSILCWYKSFIYIFSNILYWKVLHFSTHIALPNNTFNQKIQFALYCTYDISHSCNIVFLHIVMIVLYSAQCYACAE